MTFEQIEARMAEIKVEMDAEGADLTALESEVRSLNAQKEELRKAAEEAEKRRQEIADGAGETKENHEEDKPMEIRDILSSNEYINAYAEYIKNGRDAEVRSLLTVNAPANGTIPVPVYLQEKIETAWESDPILSRVNKTYIKGNVKVPFELSADGAYIHPEGTTAPTEEALTFGLVELKPETIKKWVSFSTEVEAMKGQAFLDYIYDELIYRVTKKLAEECLDDITTANATNGASAIGVPRVDAAPAITTIPTAMANLGEDAQNLVVIMNRQTEVEFLAAHAAGNFAIDPYAGLPRAYTGHLPAYASASANDVYAIVADLRGMQVNFPDGDDVTTVYDALTKKKEDIVEVLGRQFAGHGITKLGRFVNIRKPAPATT